MEKILTKTRIRSASQMNTELTLLKSLAISLVGKDDEGEYRPEFVEEVLRSLRENPRHTFTHSDKLSKMIHTYA